MSNYPAYPNQPFEPMPTGPARPKSIDTSFMLWMVNAGIGLVSLILVFAVGRDTLREQVRLTDSSLTPAEVDTAVTAGLTFAAIIGLAFMALYVLFAMKMRAGRNWARITLAVLGGLSVIYGLAGLSGSGAIISIVTIIQVVIVVAAVYFMFTKDSAAYFDAAKRA